MKLVVVARACFGMFFHSAFASATGAVSRGARMEQVSLDLTGPGHDCRFAFDGDPAAHSVSLLDFFASDIAAPASLLPPAIGSPPAEQGRFHKDVRGTLLS